MKKTRYFLFLLSLFICFVATVNAETSTKNVTVGDVDEPIYSVEIHWSDMKFDWKYDEYYKYFKFTPNYACTPVTIDSARAAELNSKSSAYLNLFGLFTNSNCNVRNTETNYVSGNTYYEMSGGNDISVIDTSVNGKVKAKATFVPSTKYNWVNGLLTDAFGCFDDGDYNVCDYVQSSGNEETLNAGFLTYDDYASEQIGSSVLHAYMKLQYDTTSSQAHNVVKDEQIGTVTLEISPDLG